jgi:hypothetical protein
MTRPKNTRIPTLEEIKSTLLLKAQLDDLVNGETGTTMTKKIAAGVADIPVKKMIDQAQFIHENLLPRVKKKGGEQSADYQFFKSVYDSLLWGIVMADRYESLERRFGQLKVFNALTQENVALLEQELQKYITLEEFFLSDSLNQVARNIKSRVEGLLKNK